LYTKAQIAYFNIFRHRKISCDTPASGNHPPVTDILEKQSVAEAKENTRSLWICPAIAVK